MVRSGLYRHVVDLVRPNVRQDEAGQEIPDPLVIDSCIPAQVRHIAGQETIRGAQIEPGITTIIRTRFREDIPALPDMQLRFEGQALQIVRVYDPDGYRRELEIQARSIPTRSDVNG